MANKLIIILLTATCWLFSACRQDDSPQQTKDPFAYPSTKYWAHGMNTVELAKSHAQHFEGMEVDINYSAFQDQLFMGHELYDTILNLTFAQWLDSLPSPANHYYWLDIKNLTTDNAPSIAHLVLTAAQKHGVQQHIMVENLDASALRIVKDSGLYVILWVDNPYWSGISEEGFLNKTQEQIDFLHPDALSGDYHNFPRLPDAFPNQNIHIWDTPRDYCDSNVAHSKTIAQRPSVNVVLVDYPVPPNE